jgi:hypothetical protein
MRDVKIEERGRGKRLGKKARHNIEANAKLKIKNKISHDLKNCENSKVYVSIENSLPLTRFGGIFLQLTT